MIESQSGLEAKSQRPAAGRLALGFGGVVVALILGWWGYLKLRAFAQEAMARAQITIFDEMCGQARSSDAREAADCLQYVVSYYPSGTKQQSGSALDLRVEAERGKAIAAIIDHLRTITSQDLGLDAEPWIQAYASSSTSASAP